jgi:hypothetical protein
MSDTPVSARKKISLLRGPVLIAFLLVLIAGGILGYVYYTNLTPEDPLGMMGFRAGVGRRVLGRGQRPAGGSTCW